MKIDEQAQGVMLRYGQRKRLAKNSYLHLGTNSCQESMLLYVERGVLAIKIMQKDYEYVYSFIGAGHFWPADLFAGFTFLPEAQVKALTEVELIIFSQTGWKLMLQQAPTFQAHLLQKIIAERRLNDSFKYARSCKGAVQRVIHVVYLLSHFYGRQLANGDYLLPDFITHKLIANLASTSTMTVHSAIKQLQALNYITFTRAKKISHQAFLQDQEFDWCFLPV